MLQKLIKIIVFSVISISAQASSPTTEKHLNLNDYKNYQSTSPLLTQRAPINYGSCAIAPQIFHDADNTVSLMQSEQNSIDKLHLLRGVLANAEHRFEELYWFDCCRHGILAYNLKKASLAAIDENLNESWVDKNHNVNYGVWILIWSIPMGIATWPCSAFDILGIPCCISNKIQDAIACCTLISVMPYATYKYAQNTQDIARRHLRWKLHDLNDLLRRLE